MQLTRALKLDRIPLKILSTAIMFELIFVAAYWIDILNGSRIHLLHSLFDLDGEANIPAWFSSAQLMFIALAFWTCALRQPRGACFRNHPSRAFFTLAGCAAVYVSMDETAQIHEQVTAWMGRRYVDWLPGFAASHFWMVMVAVALAMTLLQLLAADLLAIWHTQRRLALVGLLGICIGLGGGGGLETIGYKLLHGERTTLWYKAEVTLEEFMEMFGASLILFSSLRLTSAFGGKRIRATRRSVKTPPAKTPSLAGAQSR